MKTLLALTYLVAATTTASADIVLHDELFDGDLPTQVDSMDFGTLTPGSYLITGALDGGTQSSGIPDGPDESDGFSFAPSNTWSLDVTSLVGVDGSLTIRPGVASGISVTSIQDDLLSKIDSGSYVFSFAPEGNAGTLTYGFRINVIPEPTS